MQNEDSADEPLPVVACSSSNQSPFFNEIQQVLPTNSK